MFSFNANAAFTVIIGVFVLYVLLSLGTGNFALDKKSNPRVVSWLFWAVASFVTAVIFDAVLAVSPVVMILPVACVALFYTVIMRFAVVKYYG